VENSGSLWPGLGFLFEKHRHLTRRIDDFFTLRKFKFKLEKSALLASPYTHFFGAHREWFRDRRERVKLSPFDSIPKPDPAFMPETAMKEVGVKGPQ